jgi:probable rRNA maturation factor
MTVLIDNQQTNHPLEIQKVQEKAQDILNALACPEGELSITVMDDAGIARLNETYLGHSGPTNVISFSMREGDFGDINPELIGDVLISMDTCVREALQADMAVEQRFDELLIHGILHLFGYDHIHDEAQARLMAAKSAELLARIGWTAEI